MPVVADTGEREEAALVDALRRGDELAFASLVNLYHPQMLRIAQTYVRDRRGAEEAVQDSWIGVLRGIHRFEGRSSLKTWLFRIVVNRAKTQAQREWRMLPFSEVWDGDEGEPAVEPERFGPDAEWVAAPHSWRETPEDRLLSGEARELMRRVIDALPPNQRRVITLRDIEGFDSAEVCNTLGITETNQRVLLHRARAKVRRELERYLDAAP